MYKSFFLKDVSLLHLYGNIFCFSHFTYGHIVFSPLIFSGLENIKLIKPSTLLNKDNLAYTTFQVNFDTSMNDHPLLM